MVLKIGLDRPVGLVEPSIDELFSSVHLNEPLNRSVFCKPATPQSYKYLFTILEAHYPPGPFHAQYFQN